MHRKSFIKALAAGTTFAGLLSDTSSASNRDTQEITPEKLRRRIRALVRWVEQGFTGGKVNLLSNLPSGLTYGGTDREDLKNLYWLQNCNLFATHALRVYSPNLAREIKESYDHWYRTEFPDVNERTEHYLAVGQLPGHTPPEGSYFRAVIKRKEFDGFTIGTETYDPDNLGRITDKDPRSLLKFGALGCQLRGKPREAKEYFEKALALWDGTGFTNTRMDRHGGYYNPPISLSFIAAHALGAPLPVELRQQMEKRLWACQDVDGGIWTNYLPDGSIPHFGKKSMEIGPLTLLAYSPKS
ncbi:MAG: hypothetical protein AB3N63_04510 [Puniceicoccaceae bacterium]